MPLLLSLALSLALAPAGADCLPPLSPVQDLSAVADALSEGAAAEVLAARLSALADEPGESVSLSVSARTDAAAGTGAANLALELSGGAAITWAASEGGAVSLTVSASGRGVGSGDVAASARAGLGLSDSRKLSLRFDDAEQAARWLLGIAGGDPGAILDDAPAARASWELGRGGAASLEFGAPGFNPRELKGAAELSRSRELAVVLDGLSVATSEVGHTRGGLNLQVPLAGHKATFAYGFHHAADLHECGGSLRQTLSASIPAAALSGLSGGELEGALAAAFAAALAGLPESEQTGALDLPEGTLAAAAAELERALAGGPLTGEVQLSVTWSWAQDPEGELTFEHRRVYLGGAATAGGELELKAGEIKLRAAATGTELVSEAREQGAASTPAPRSSP
jgi:hypothetical protein